MRSLLLSIGGTTQNLAGAPSVATEHRPRPEHPLPTFSPSVASHNDECPPWALLAPSASRPAHICGPDPPAARRRAAWPASRRGTRPRTRAVPAGHGRWPPPRRPGLGRQARRRRRRRRRLSAVASLLTSSAGPAGARRHRVQRRRGPKAGAPSPSRLAPGVGRASRRAEAVAASAGGAGAAPPRGPRWCASTELMERARKNSNFSVCEIDTSAGEFHVRGSYRKNCPTESLAANRSRLGHNDRGGRQARAARARACPCPSHVPPQCLRVSLNPKPERARSNGGGSRAVAAALTTARRARRRRWSGSAGAAPPRLGGRQRRPAVEPPRRANRAHTTPPRAARRSCAGAAGARRHGLGAARGPAHARSQP